LNAEDGRISPSVLHVKQMNNMNHKSHKRTPTVPVDRHYYDALASRARGQYNHEYAVGYRRSDDRGVDGPTHTDFGDLLTETCLSFAHSISVLDLACGTGRYFHHLRNVQRLIGIDISLDMLMQARHPVREEVLQAKPKLICSNLADFECPDATFDLIYAIGVLGEFGCFALLASLSLQLLTVPHRVKPPGSGRRRGSHCL
jgi:SAM-dependent methyltransferase